MSTFRVAGSQSVVAVFVALLLFPLRIIVALVRMPSRFMAKMRGPYRIGQCDIQEILGQGQNGIVYRARRMSDGRVVAVKILLAGDFADQEQKVRFQREAHTTGRLRHNNIVTLLDSGVDDRIPYIVYEFVAGGSLERTIGDKPQEVKWAVLLVQKLANALVVAHSSSMIHRDLKPANVLLTEDGEPKISDFGLAKDQTDQQALTLSGRALGTADYMAPEQIDHPGHVGPQADFWSLGAIFYKLLVGRAPFHGETDYQTMNRVQNGEFQLPSKVRDDLPPDVDRICLRCLDRDPKKRYASGQELADDLGRLYNRL